jgi:plasmid stabilization system protein ParE
MKAAPLTFAEDFQEDVNRQVKWLETEHPTWVAKLEAGLNEAFDLLSAFPEAGSVTSTPEVRKLVLHRLPFVIWYAVEEEPLAVVVLRLFHARQHRRR